MDNVPMHVIAIVSELEKIAKQRATVDHEILIKVKELDGGRSGAYAITCKLMIDPLSEFYSSESNRKDLVDRANYMLFRRLEIEPQETSQLLARKEFKFGLMADGKYTNSGGALIDHNWIFANTMAGLLWQHITPPRKE